MQRIFLTGLSGAGKSSVGRQLARLLGWDVADTDDLLAEHCGMPVGQALIEYGEERFRQLESEMLVSATRQERVVIATGGGAVIAEANRTFMREHGLVVYLAVSVETAWQRVQEQMRRAGTTAARPLLMDNGRQRLQDLYTVRQQWYEQAKVHIATDEHTSESVAERIFAFALAYGYLSSASLAREVATLTSGMVTSQAVIEWGGLHHLAQALQAAGFTKRVFIVTDIAVGQLYTEPVERVLTEAGLAVHTFTVPAGEASKSMQYWQQALDWLVEYKAEQQEPVLALGGGVVGDLAGFVAACYHRGVPFVQIPTSLLAQVDAAIGGKTGINHARGKNLVGAFYQPRLIVVDPALLLTLPERVYREGWAEIVKYGMILDTELFELLEARAQSLDARDAALLTEIVARCIRMKMDVVQRDERDGGLRNILNYGHTFGHALETLTDYGTWLHGEVVALGMEVAARIARAQGLLSDEAVVRQHELLCALHLPVHCAGIDIDAVLTAMQRDKKVRAGRTRWVLPTRIGHAEVYGDIPIAIIRDAIIAICN